MAVSGSWSLPVMSIMGCMPPRRIRRAWRRIRRGLVMGGSRVGRELAAGLEFVPQVGQRVGFAVEVGGDDGPGGGEQVRPVQAGVGEFGAEPGDLGGQGGGVGERGFELLPDLGRAWARRSRTRR